MKRKKRVAMAIAILLALLMILPMLISVFTTTAAAVSQEEINHLKENADGLVEQKKALTAKLKKLEADQSAAIEKKELLDEQNLVIQEQIANISAQINHYTDLVAQKQVELEEAEVKEREQYALFATRVRAMEENGTVSYWSILFNAGSFSDLLGRLDFVGEVMEYDQGVIERLKAARQQIVDTKASLESDKAEQEAAKTDLSNHQAELQSQLAAADALVDEIESKADEYKDTLDKIEADEAKVQAEIAKKIKQLEAQGSSVVGEGDYLWPTPASHRITSDFGERWHPIKKKYSFHYGIDVGLSIGNKVLASKSGTVIISKKSSSYGNYIVISHGKGNTTLYAHLNKRAVSEGDVVKQGDVIGYSGNTGWSTGPHLHFEISENGVRVDPESKF